MDRSSEECQRAQRRPLPAFHDGAPHDRFCDLILTGGVTSAVAYPAAIFTLASAYRLRSLGGSSSGAGSAALAAAAEYRRRHGSGDGFRLLLERTSEIADTTQGRTNLAWLFQPGRHKRRLFSAVVAVVAPPGHKGRRFVAAFFKAYFLWPLLLAGGGSAAVACHAAPGWAWVLGVIGLWVGALWGAAWLWIDVRRVLHGGYGLCSGLEQGPGVHHPPLTPWLHALIQEVAGRPDDAPLTFADLEAAPGSPRETLGTCAVGDELGIRLQMFTANLTLGRPCLFPLAGHPDDGPPPTREPGPWDDAAALYFLESEMRVLFPASVVAHLLRVSTPYGGPAVRGDGSGAQGAGAAGPAEPFRRLPGLQLPVVVAARMSVSFPVLFQAVPLWAVERKRDPVAGTTAPRMRRCHFADGGFCSNFPIHLFDSAVPDWPTFGMALRDLIDKPEHPRTLHEQRQDMLDSIHLPTQHDELIDETWHDFDVRGSSLARLGGWVGAMLSTVKDWNDATLARLPGVRDRVVRLGLAPGIGGLNILMSGDQIRVLGEVGAEAAKRLLERFAQPHDASGQAPGWREHRWVRFNILRDGLAETLSGFGASAASRKFTQPLSEHIQDATAQAPLHGDEHSRLRASQAAALQGVLAALEEAERALSASAAVQPYQPAPRPHLRIRPPL